MSDDCDRIRRIFDDRGAILKIWIDERRSRDNSANLMWENLKFFSTLISALITANTVFLGYTFNISPEAPRYALTATVISILIIYLSYWGERDLKRRWERTAEAIAHLTKLEDLLGLRELLPRGAHVLGSDKRLFQRYFEETEDIISESAFVKKNMKGHNMYKAMNKVYLGLIGIGVILIAIPVIVVFF